MVGTLQTRHSTCFYFKSNNLTLNNLKNNSETIFSYDDDLDEVEEEEPLEDVDELEVINIFLSF